VLAEAVFDRPQPLARLVPRTVGGGALQLVAEPPHHRVEQQLAALPAPQLFVPEQLFGGQCQGGASKPTAEAASW
jgi:hypothetical protein